MAKVMTHSKQTVTVSKGGVSGMVQLMKRRVNALKMAAQMRVLALYMVLSGRMQLVAEDAGQEAWISQVMIIGIILLIAALVFAFGKGGGTTWVQSRLSGITSY